MGKHFIDPKSSEILSIFRKLPFFGQNCPLFLKKPWYPCPFEILEETLYIYVLMKQGPKGSASIHVKAKLTWSEKQSDQDCLLTTSYALLMCHRTK
jgi:hypothetical protein